MLTEGNLAHNIACLTLMRSQSPPGPHRGLSWLPMYHDMGLISCLFMPLANGDHVWLMSPVRRRNLCYFFLTKTQVTFIKNPTLWIEKLSEHKIHDTASPTFGYALVTRKWPKNHAPVDLSSVTLAACAAERIFPAVLADFTAKFKQYGWRQETLTPSYVSPSSPKSDLRFADAALRYGLAEDSVYVSNKPRDTVYVVTDDDRVSCGVPNRPDLILKIVNPEDMREVRALTIRR